MTPRIRSVQGSNYGIMTLQGCSTFSGLRKVTDDMKTHKNPALRTGPQPFKPSIGPKPTAHPAHPPKPAAKTEQTKPAKCALEGKKWIVVSSVLSVHHFSDVAC
jgi:hypothetical protein